MRGSSKIHFSPLERGKAKKEATGLFVSVISKCGQEQLANINMEVMSSSTRLIITVGLRRGDGVGGRSGFVRGTLDSLDWTGWSGCLHCSSSLSYCLVLLPENLCFQPCRLVSLLVGWLVCQQGYTQKLPKGFSHDLNGECATARIKPSDSSLKVNYWVLGV